MPPLAPVSEMDAEALSRRVDATCCGHYKVEVGHVVEHYISERVYVVTHVHEWWGDSRDVGGGEIEVLELNAGTGLPLKTIESAASDDEPSDGEPPDDWPRTTEDVYLFRGTWVKTEDTESVAVDQWSGGRASTRVQGVRSRVGIVLRVLQRLF